MAQFPILKTGAVLQYPATKSFHFSNTVHRFLDGSDQRFRSHKQIVRRWSIRLDLLDDGEMAALEEFLAEQKGQLGDFSFFDPWDEIDYNHCSLDLDSSSLNFDDYARGSAVLWVRER